MGVDGISTDPQKIEALHCWPQPTNVKELRSFLGLSGYYRIFVQNYAILARPLSDLLKKGAIFVWTTPHSEAFEAIKQSLISAPVLVLPNFNKQFQIHTDASDKGVGAVLMQDGHPLAFISKALGPQTLGLSTYEREYLAVLIAVEQW